ncbi:thiamine-phosphate kinase [bacterium]|nr:thiamine-phosphate kinase [candidate division CSSED10-310 bacterium]
MKLNDLGEFGLIQRLTKNFKNFNPHLLLGIGDDCAVEKITDEYMLLVTTDLLIEHVHFVREKIPPRFLGRKSLSVNLSDIAAMGGEALGFYISIAIPRTTELTYLDEVFLGLQEISELYGVTLAGGDTTASKSDLTINITVTGKAKQGNYITRKGALVGDFIQVSGPLGSSAAGLQITLRNLASNRYPNSYRAHIDPQPRLKVGQALGRSGAVTAMIDVSDGLLQDLTHICNASKVGAELDFNTIPKDDEIILLSNELNMSWENWVLGGGEDYELCWTVSPHRELEILKIAEANGAPAPRTIGQITDAKGIKIYRNGCDFPITTDGWDHFRFV